MVFLLSNLESKEEIDKDFVNSGNMMNKAFKILISIFQIDTVYIR